MHRANLIKLLSEYKPTAGEVIAKSKMLDFVNSYSNCFDRELEVGHITASAWLLDKNAERALLMHHRKLDLWLQLGGHADGDFDVLNVAIKEAQEESGILAIEPIRSTIFDIDIHEIPANAMNKSHFHYDVRFLLQVKSNEEVKINNEAKELRWIKSSEELPTNEESILRMFNKWSEFAKSQPMASRGVIS